MSTARERRRARRASALAAAMSGPRACIECGRGEINTALLAPPYDTVNVKLVLAPCVDAQMHRPPRGPHIGRCHGWVWRHENPRICAAVKAQGRTRLLTAGAN